MEIIVILLLILLNGIFAMVEIAVVSARKSRLQHLANEGSKNAQAVLDLKDSPNRFLSTVQIGITLIGILAGAFGGATIAENLAAYFKTIPSLAPYSEAMGIAIVVAAITYLSLIIGELVPKRLGLSNPELIASAAARPMRALSKISAPLVYLSVLATDKEIYPEGIISGFFGTITERAVKRFQNRHGLAETGVIDSNTLSKFNEVFGGQAMSASPTPSSESKRDNIFIRVWKSIMSFWGR